MAITPEQRSELKLRIDALWRKVRYPLTWDADRLENAESPLCVAKADYLKKIVDTGRDLEEIRAFVERM